MKMMMKRKKEIKIKKENLIMEKMKTQEK